MASTIIDPTAERVVDVLEAISGLTVYKWSMPSGVNLPAAIVGRPDIRRTAIDEPESQLGSRDWAMSFLISIFVDLSKATTSQAASVDYAEAFIVAVDANPSLGDPTIADDAKVTSAEPDFELEGTRPMVTYYCTLELTKLV